MKYEQHGIIVMNKMELPPSITMLVLCWRVNKKEEKKHYGRWRKNIGRKKFGPLEAFFSSKPIWIRKENASFKSHGKT